MRYFPDQPARGMWARYAIAVLPLLFLIVALLYSASSAPWGRQVDPETTYAMNGIAWADDGLMRKNDHPGTATILLIGLVVKLWTVLAGSPDLVEFGLKNFDAVIYASRAAEALILFGALLASGVIVRNATRSALAAMLFQIAPFVHPSVLHFEAMLAPESLMASCAILGMALVLKATLADRPPTIGLGVAMGLVFAFGLSSKYLHLPLAILGVCLLRNPRAFAMAALTGIFSFAILNRIFNPLVFSMGWHWLVNLATHKGIYGTGEAGFIDFQEFWPNMATILLAAPVVSAIFAIGALAALARLVTSRRFLDPISLTLMAAFLAFAAQLVATSKHFALHYMTASWVLTGGVLVLTFIEIRRLFPGVSARLVAGAAVLACAMPIAVTLVQIKHNALEDIALNDVGAKLGQAVVAAGPACANVSSRFVRAPENDLSFGADTTLSTVKMEERYSEIYQRAFKVSLLDHSSYLLGELRKNFLPFSYPQLAAEYPCIVVRTYQPLNATTSLGLLELNPDYCQVGGINVYAVGIACEEIRSAYAKLSLIQDTSLFR
jgi:hypothetical protein